VSVYTLTEEERAWLKAVHAELWPDQHIKKNEVSHRIKLTAHRPLTHVEFSRVLELIDARSLLTQMFSTSMFGGYGMHVYEHEPFPNTAPMLLLMLIEDHLPDPHRLAVAEGDTRHIKRPGAGRDDAWESFSKFTHSERNIEWLKGYKMELPRDRSYYDY
jgi:hypothetical protein